MLESRYVIPAADDRSAIGRRADRLRNLLGMTTGQVAAAAKVTVHDVEALEKGNRVTLEAALAIHRVLSGDGAGDTLFTRPRLRTIDEVEAYERRRLRSR